MFPPLASSSSSSSSSRTQQQQYRTGCGVRSNAEPNIICCRRGATVVAALWLHGWAQRHGLSRRRSTSTRHGRGGEGSGRLHGPYAMSVARRAASSLQRRAGAGSSSTVGSSRASCAFTVFLRDCLGHHERRSQHCGAQCPRCLPEPPLAEALAGHALSVRTAWRAGPPEGIRPDHEHCADGESRAGVFDVSRLLLRRLRPCCSAYMIWLRTQRC